MIQELRKPLKQYVPCQCTSCHFHSVCLAERDVNTGGAASSTAGWTGWAVSGMTSLTSKIYKGKSPGPPSQPQKPAANVPPNGNVIDNVVVLFSCY